jgi:two-component system response regulator AtoC
LKSVIELSAFLSTAREITAADILLNKPQQFTSLMQDEKTMEGYMLQIIKHYLGKYNNDIPLVSRKLDLGKSTIYKLLKAHKFFFEETDAG